MGKHLTDEDIAKICEILDDWPLEVKLTWENLVEAALHDLGLRTTRQSMEKKSRIKNALHEVKKLAKDSKKSNWSNEQEPSRPPSLKIAMEQIAVRDRKIDRLEKENQQSQSQFQIWLYNAYNNGISIEKLNASLPKKD